MYLKNSGLGGKFYIKKETLNFAAKREEMSNAWEETLNVDFMQDFYLHVFECHGNFNGLV